MDSTFRFPHGFMLGAATSAHQVEGYCHDNDWWAWEASGQVAERSGEACDHYRRFREDFDLSHELGHNTHRFSLEWSRIEPAPGRFNDEALRHYREVLIALRERGMEPIVTLHHFTLPTWLAAIGGWRNPASVAFFERFVRVAIYACGDLASWWITINEPLGYVFKAYVSGQWPPGVRDYGAAREVVRHLLRAHVAAYLAIHERQPHAHVSIAHHALALSPDNPLRLRDRMSLRFRDLLVNRLVIDALHHGAVHIPGVMWERLEASRTLDFIGVNYYTRDFVRNAGFSMAGLLGDGRARSHRSSVRMRNGLGWEVYPEGLGQVCASLARYRLPILIAENGIATENDGDRCAFISMHLWEVIRQMARGVPIIGYLYWSLLDNFEWAEGYRARFGLIEVDYATQRRTVRESGRWMAQVIARGGL